MIKCVVELFGLPHQPTDLREVEVGLNDGAQLGDVIAALRREIPTLNRHVIVAEEDRLVDYCAFNINGHFYFDDQEVQLRDGDRLILLTLATGG